jgi:hypothetical protein
MVIRVRLDFIVGYLYLREQLNVHSGFGGVNINKRSGTRRWIKLKRAEDE